MPEGLKYIVYVLENIITQNIKPPEQVILVKNDFSVIIA